MSNLEKEQDFIRFLLSSPLKKQAKGLLLTLTPSQNLAVREIIYNVGQQFPTRYQRLKKKVYKPLSKHFLTQHWESLLAFLKQHASYVLKKLDEEVSFNST